MFRVPIQRTLEIAVEAGCFLAFSSLLTPFFLSLVSQQLCPRNNQGSMPRIMEEEQGFEMGSAGGHRGETSLVALGPRPASFSNDL